MEPADVDIMMGTFTKSFGSCGGYIAGSKVALHHFQICLNLVNRVGHNVDGSFLLSFSDRSFLSLASLLIYINQGQLMS